MAYIRSIGETMKPSKSTILGEGAKRKKKSLKTSVRKHNKNWMDAKKDETLFLNRVLLAL